MGSINKGSLSDIILQTLEKSVDGFLRFEDFCNNSHIYARGYQRDLKKSSLSQSLKRLREQGYINKEIFEGRVIYKLTDKGIGKSVGSNLEKKDWDGKWRIIIFDIPEQNRRIRKALRSRLKMWEFEMWQRSVWATKKDIARELNLFIKEVGIEDWVVIIESEKIFSSQKRSDRTFFV